ncbi:unnamed protein product [Rhizophagus irregularis]|nr:unnamed protein product [Rhizophagus irregularis]
MLKGYTLTASIFDAHDICTSDHNPLDSVSTSQWDDFTALLDSLCDVMLSTFTSIPRSSKRQVLDRVLDNSLMSKTLSKTFKVKNCVQNLSFGFAYPRLLFTGFLHFFSLSHISKTLRGLHVLKEREFQEASITAHIDRHNDNGSISNQETYSFGSRLHLVTDPKDIMSKTINYFQNYVPINLPFTIEPSALPKCWANAYAPIASVDASLLDPPSMDMISYEMLKHLGPHAYSLLLNLIHSCFGAADIPDLWRQATVFPIPKPHEWKCQLKKHQIYHLIGSYS